MSSERRNNVNNYPEAVAKIASDYLERVKSQLCLVPSRERDEFLRELQSHLYEAYRQTPGEDDVGRILEVLRNLGEPAEVVSDRLAGAMVRSGARRSLPLYIVGGILIAMFGVPLGFGGVGVPVGLVFALAGIVLAYYATAGSILLAGAMSMSMGLTRIFLPHLWDNLVTLRYIQMNGAPGELFDHLSRSEQGFLMILIASVLIASGLGMLWPGRYLLRGLRFLFSLVFDWTRRLAQSVRGKLCGDHHTRPHVGDVSFANNGQ
ncbi:MAG: hypothetical protein ABSG03_13340 [Bryobacteraceae bacterium]